MICLGFPDQMFLPRKEGFKMVKPWIFIAFTAALLTGCGSDQAFKPISSPTIISSNILLQDFPVMPGGAEIEDNRAAYHYAINANIDDVRKFYREHLENTEWELIEDSDVSGADLEAALLMFANTESIVTIQVWVKEDLTHVAFIIDDRYPIPSS
jgi:hypothetical protein